MKETEFYKAMINACSVDDEKTKTAAYRAVPQRSAAWRRAAIAGLSAAVLIAAVFLIPTARAEVLRWFGISRPEEYLTTGADERPSIPEIDGLIATPAPDDPGTVPIPIEPKDLEMSGEDVKSLSAFLYENCDVRLGEALFDGDTIYQTVRMEGLSGLYLLDEWTSGLSTAVRIDEKTALEWGEDGEPIRVMLDGEPVYIQRPFGNIRYELPDGTRFGGMLELTDTGMEPLLHSEALQTLRSGERTEKREQALYSMSRTYLEENGLTAYASITPFDWERYLDADGNLTAKVIYTVWAETAPPGMSDSLKQVFSAELGTISINMRGWEELETRRMTADAPTVAWSAQDVTVGRVTYVFRETTEGYETVFSFSKHRVSTDGVLLSADTKAAAISALGIRGIVIRVATPTAWTEEERMAFADSLRFTVLLDDERGNWYPRCFGEVQEDGSILYAVNAIEGVPYSQLRSIRTVSFLPVLQETEAINVFPTFGGEGEPTLTLDPPYGETAESTSGVFSYDQIGTVREYPKYAITLTVQ